MVVMVKPEPKRAEPENAAEKFIIQSEDNSKFALQNVIENIIVVERVKNKKPQDSVEYIVKIFAWIFAILSAFGSFAFILELCKRLYRAANFRFIYPEDEFLNRFCISILLLMITYTTISYAFCVILLKGLKMRKPTLVLTYFVYGVINVTFALVFLLSVIIINYNLALYAPTKFTYNKTEVLILLYATCIAVYGSFLYAVKTIYGDYVLNELREAEEKRMEPYNLPLKFSKASKIETV